MNASSSSRRSRLLASLCGVAAALVLLGLGWAARRLVEERRDLDLLDSKDATAARAAAARLAKLGSWRATERLVTLLRERARAAEQERQWVKEALRERLPGALVQLGAEIEDGWDDGDHAVLHFLEDLGAEAQPAVPALVRSLEAIDHEDGSFAISFALLWIDPRGYEAVRPLLRSPSVVARTNALGVLRMADAVPASYLSELAASLHDAEPVVRTEAAWTLQSLRPDATTARAALGPRLLDEDPNARLAAACALVSLGAAGKETVPVLLEGLRVEGFHERSRAVKSLEALGPLASDAVPSLVELLQDSSTLSSDALDAVLAIAPIEAARLVAPSLRDPDGEVRRLALIAIGPLSLHDPGHVAMAARAAVEVPEQGLVSWANGALGELGPAAAGAVPSLIELLQEPDPTLQDLASYILGGIGEAAGAAVPALRTLEADPRLDPELRRSAAWALGSILGTDEASTAVTGILPGEAERYAADLAAAELERRELALKDLQHTDGLPMELLPVVVRCLQAPEPEIRAGAIRALGSCAPDLDRTLRVAAALADGAADVRVAAMSFLSGVEEPPAEVLQAVHGSLAAPDAGVRAAALNVLEGWGAAARPAEAAIARLLGDADPAVREAAADTLGALTALTRTTAEALGAALADSHLEVRRASVSALGAAGEVASAAEADLQRALTDTDSQVQFCAAAVLWSLGPVADEVQELLDTALQEMEQSVNASRLLARLGARAAPQLRLALNSPSSEVRTAAAEVLCEHGERSAWAVPDLIRALSDPNSLVCSRVILALAAIGAPARAAGPALARAAIEDENAYNRVWAGYALGRLEVHQEVAGRSLTRELGRGGEELRERAAQYLGRLGAHGRDAVPALEKALRSRYRGVRTAAATALRRIRAAGTEVAPTHAIEASNQPDLPADMAR